MPAVVVPELQALAAVAPMLLRQTGALVAAAFVAPEISRPAAVVPELRMLAAVMPAAIMSMLLRPGRQRRAEHQGGAHRGADQSR
jgi:hypothetical protein